MDEKQRRPSISQLSKTPSWVMLGIVIGALSVLAWPRKEPSVRTIVVTQPAEETKRPQEAPLLTTVEAVFDQWSEYAVWDNNVTQVALWNPSVGDFAEFYEVRRMDGVNYFRSIPRLTNRVLRHGKAPPPECPLRFTETDEQYREWREQGRYERPAEDSRPSRPAPQPAPAMPRPSVSVEPVTPGTPELKLEPREQTTQ